jgi:hypothetical protein
MQQVQHRPTPQAAAAGYNMLTSVTVLLMLMLLLMKAMAGRMESRGS